MRQWVLKITEYAERLLADLEDLDWPESVKQMQRVWIGRSEGVDISFDIDQFKDKQIKVFTTRADTLFGVTAIVLAPEHELVGQLTSSKEKSKVEAYVKLRLKNPSGTASARQKERAASLDLLLSILFLCKNTYFYS